MTKTRYFVETKDWASEIKFLVDSDVAEGIRSYGRNMLKADPHGSGPHGDEYLTTSLYFDTDEFDVFRRIGSYRRSKYRIRRYGNSDFVFLERKMRTRKVLSKRRTLVHCDELARLAEKKADPEWAGAWFHERLRVRRFAPVSQVSYHRTARIAETELGIIRLTVDDDLRAIPAAGLLYRPDCGNSVNPGKAIIEFKYRLEMPAVFKQLMEQFGIVPQRVSKYRMSATALGLASSLQNKAETEPEEMSVTVCMPL